MSVKFAFGVCRFDEVGSLRAFGVNGVTSTAIPKRSFAHPQAIGIDSNGRIVIAGYAADKPESQRNRSGVVAIANYLPSGELNRQRGLIGSVEIGPVGNDGVFINDYSSSSFESANSLCIKGKAIFVAGEAVLKNTRDKVIAIAKYGERTGHNGEFGLDTSFGGDGVVFTDFRSRDGESGVAIEVENNNRVWVVANTTDKTFTQRIGISVYLPNGTLDNLVDGDGKILLDRNSTVHAMAISGSSVYVAGQRRGWWVIYKLRTTGNLDPAFGSNGSLLLRVPGGFRYRSCNAIRVDSSGRIVAAGTAEKSGKRRFAVARFKANGALDASFGSGGIVTVDFVTGEDESPSALTIDAANRIVVAGTATHKESGQTRPGVFRLLPNGDLDLSFSGDGKAWGPSSMVGATGVVTDGRNRVILTGAVDVSRITFGDNQTGFVPTLHGLRYGNDTLHQELQSVGGGNLYVGLTFCGGMAVTAHDYYAFDRIAPDRLVPPPDGERLRTYVFQRQMDTLGWKGKLPTDRPIRSALRTLNPFKAALPWRREFRQWHKHERNGDLLGWSFSQLERLSQVLKAHRKPALIGLIYEDADKLFDNHQVLAYGMSGADIGTPAAQKDLIDNPNKSRLIRIHIYDPNFPNDNYRCLLLQLGFHRVGVTSSGRRLTKQLRIEWVTKVKLPDNATMRKVRRVMNVPNPSSESQKQINKEVNKVKKDLRGFFLMSPSGFDNRPNTPLKDPGSRLA